MVVVFFHCPFMGLSGCHDGGGNGLTKTSLITHLHDRHCNGDAQIITKQSLKTSLAIFEAAEVTFKCMGLWLCGVCFKTHTFRSMCRHGEGSNFVSPPIMVTVRLGLCYMTSLSHKSLFLVLHDHVDELMPDEHVGFTLTILDRLLSKGLRTVKSIHPKCRLGFSRVLKGALDKVICTPDDISCWVSLLILPLCILKPFCLRSSIEFLDMIKSFPCGTSYGRDGLRAQHLMDCLSGAAVAISGISKLYFSMSTCSPQVFEQARRSFDAALRSSLEHIITASDPGFGDCQWRLSTLPFAFGGLGVYSISDVLSYAFIASRLEFAGLQSKLLRDSNIVTFGPAFDNALSTFNSKMEIDLLINPSEVAAPKLMKKLADIYFTHVTQTAESTFSLSTRQMALWKSQMEEHTSDWLRVVPIFGLGQTMNGRTYRCGKGTLCETKLYRVLAVKEVDMRLRLEVCVESNSFLPLGTSSFSFSTLGPREGREGLTEAGPKSSPYLRDIEARAARSSPTFAQTGMSEFMPGPQSD
ncbi:hypothetical protein Tco_0722875 [Tanacetum coccineum]